MLVHWHVDYLTPSLRRLARASDIDQDPPHQLGADCEEMGPARPADSPNIDEPDVQLVDEGRRLKCGIRLFAGHVVVGESVEFSVDERYQSVARALVASRPGLQESGHFRRRRNRSIRSRRFSL